MDDMQEIMDDFFQEADESLDELEQDLIKLETACDTGTFDSDLVDRIFRVLHTLKGGAGFLNLKYMASLSHAGESLLDEVRGGAVKVNTEVMDALLKTNDLLKELLEKEKSGEDPSTIDISTTVEVLEKLIDGKSASSDKKPEDAPVPDPIQTDIVEAATPQDIVINEELLAEIQADDRLEGGDEEEPVAEVEKEGTPKFTVNEELLAEIQADDRLEGGDEEELVAEVEKEDTPKFAVNEELLAEIQADDRLEGGDEKEEKEEKEELKTQPVIKVETVATEVVEEEAVVTRGAKPQDDRREKEDRRKQPRRQVEAEATIRVETGKLDKTMNLVGELVLARNSLVRYLHLPEMKNILQTAPYINEVMTNIEHLSQVTKDLQLSVLSMRMQAIKKVFDKIPRQVRDLKSKLNREVDLVIQGEFTEVDKSLVEELADPMVHLIRNSLDHGIETPDDREAVGKKRTGTLTINAFYEGNKVVIQVKDDGAGIDPEKIKNLALKKGIISEKEAEDISDDDAVKLIMAAGFSTAETISDVSGRGVGMDVVNSSIQAIKGSVDIVSEFGVGTTINIYLPLTLAIVQALVVKSRYEGFAIPIGDINEVIKFQDREVHKMNDQDVIELRGAVLPLFYLSELTSNKTPFLKSENVEIEGHVETHVVEEIPEQDDHTPPQALEEKVLKPKEETKASQLEKDNINNYVVVVREGKHSLGLVVDNLIGQEEAVIKALSSDFEYHSAISGATITGDGTVHMILDVPYLIKKMSKR
jgi:two-component system chemotaxis sensor kinase CheA